MFTSLFDNLNPSATDNYPMFKRVVKRQKKRQEDEENGITEEVKEMMGWQDSDESSSESDQSEKTEASSSDSEDEHPTKKRKRKDEDEDESSDEDSERGHSSPASESGDDQVEVNDEEISRMTVREALKNSIEEQNCVICPGKLLKNIHMEKTHLESASHKRRLKRFSELAAKLSAKFDVYSDSVSLVVQLMDRESSGPGKHAAVANSSEMSNRAKRRQRIEKMKEKRKRKKMKAAAAANSELGRPKKKKRTTEK
ncbi:SubName: Full=Uncharacterized protein {ECO:0000313/EMBL:CCA74004.1} [Serendipita indica DSM 11827]|nr:SubName: Full=Uncharacterized protein {ECO:0000313/EMBL:CCA74004.1} [Serendipita indica DSM 11827]